MREGRDAYMPEDQFEPTQLVQFAEQLAPYDPVDLLAAAGGLQLLPENAHRAIRLEVLAHVIASLEDQQPNRPHARMPSSVAVSCSRCKEGNGRKIIGMDIRPLRSEEMCSASYYTTFPFTESAGEPDRVGHHISFVSEDRE